MTGIKRYLDEGEDSIFDNFKKDFDFLFSIIKNDNGEMDLRLRDNVL